MNPGRQIAPAPRSEEGAPARYERYEQTNPLQRMNSMPSAAGSSEGEQYPSSLTTSLNTSSSSRKPLVAKAGPRRQGRPSSSSSESHGHRKKRGGGRITTVAATVLFVLGVLLLVEMMVVVAYVAAPLVGLMRTMETTIDTVNTPDYRLKLEFDASEKLTIAGASVIGPLFRYLSPSDEEAFRTQSTANANASSSAAFVDWCQQAECMGSISQVLCEQLNQAMLTSTHADGSPVLPLPKPFCATLETLSTKKCLCDPDLAKASQETQELVNLASASAIMCHIDGLIAPTTSGC